MSDRSCLDALFFLEIYSGLLHLTPLIYTEIGFVQKTKVKCDSAFILGS